MTSSSDTLMALLQQTRAGNGTPFPPRGQRGHSDESLLVLSDALRNFTLLEPTPASTRDALVIFSYSVVFVVSLFGNTLVCHVVLRNRSMRTTTNAFITNLAVSDLMMTSLNVPFTVARLLLSDWPFGKLMCGLVPFVQVTSVYVSTFTMTAIALHRYRVIVNPFTSRSRLCPSTSIIAGVWVASACLSLPHAVFNDIVEKFTVRHLVRCQVVYPEPEVEVRRWITLLTFASQFALPLSVTGITYGRVVRRVWARKVPGASVTAEQAISSLRAKRKTIKMLMLVVVLFALCWLPLNLYHVLQDFEHPDDRFKSNPIFFFVCHWLAMSSVCYNPFIYWWLNESFRAAFKGWLTCTTPQAPASTSVEHSEAIRQSSGSGDRRPACWYPGSRTGRDLARTPYWFFGARLNRSASPVKKSVSWMSGLRTRFSFRRTRSENRLPCPAPVRDDETGETGSIRLQPADWLANGSPCASPPTDLSNRTTSSLNRCASPDQRFGRMDPAEWIVDPCASPPMASPLDLQVTNSNWFRCWFRSRNKKSKLTFL